MNALRRIFACLTVGLLAANCGGGASRVLPASGRPPGSAAASVSLVVKVPARTTSSRAARWPRYISPSTASVVLTMNGSQIGVINTGAGSSQCASDGAGAGSVCTGNFAVNAGTYAYDLGAFDGPNGAGTKLSTSSGQFVVVPNQANTLHAVLDGVVKSLRVSLNPSVVQQGVPTTVQVSVSAIDPDGNAIISGSFVDASGNPMVATISTSDKSGSLQISRTTISTSQTISASYNGATIPSQGIAATAPNVLGGTATLSVVTPSTVPSGSITSVALLAAPSDGVTAGGSWIVAAAVVEADGAPVSGTAVHLTASAGTLTQADGVTNSDGVYSTTMNPPPGGSTPAVAIVATAGTRVAVAHISFSALSTSGFRRKTSNGPSPFASLGLMFGKGLPTIGNPLYSANPCHVPLAPSSPACQQTLNQQHIATTTPQTGLGAVCATGREYIDVGRFAACAGLAGALGECLAGVELLAADLIACGVELTYAEATPFLLKNCVELLASAFARSQNQTLVLDHVLFSEDRSYADGFLSLCDDFIDTIKKPSNTISLTLSPKSFSTGFSGYQPTLTATGSGLNAVRSITFTQTGAMTSGPYTWTMDGSSWNTALAARKLVLNQDGSMTLRPVVTQNGDKPGQSTWTVSMSDGQNQANDQFTVNYEPSGTLDFTISPPTDFSTSAIGYQPTLNAVGSGFNNVNKITFVQTGAMSSGPYTWTKADSTWNTALNEGKLLINTDKTMTLKPIVTANGDRSGRSTWTVTVNDGTTTKSQTFTVTYTPTALNFALSPPTDFSTSLANFQPTLSGTGSGLLSVNKITFLQTGAMSSGPYVWSKSDSTWNTAVAEGKLLVSGDTAMTLKPVVTQQGDKSGLSTWYITMTDGVNSKQQTFTVNYAPATTLTFTLLPPTSFSTTSLNYQPTLSASGSGFLGVSKITFLQSGAMASGPYVWSKDDGTWNAAIAAGKLLVNGDTSMILKPVVTALGDKGGVSTWSVSITDGTAMRSQTFSVNYIH
jgi:hypothetical protein